VITLTHFEYAALVFFNLSAGATLGFILAAVITAYKHR
jgi:hypothetical protein